MKSPVLIKVLIITLLTFALMIPLSMVRSTIEERSSYKAVAQNSIQKSWASPQKVIGPILTVAYSYRETKSVYNPQTKTHNDKVFTRDSTAYFLPEKLEITSSTDVDFRSRGIYEIPVYTSTIRLSGHFSMAAFDAISKEYEDFAEWKEGQLSIVLTDPRGINKQKVSFDEEELSFAAGVKLKSKNSGMHAEIGAIDNIAKPNKSFVVELELSGMNHLQFVPVGKETHTIMNSTWPHPSFVGDYLPQKREISQSGFIADWKQSWLSTGIEQDFERCKYSSCEVAFAKTYGVSFLEPVDIYRQTTRSAKYGILVISLVFISFFLCEMMSGMRIHPMQYILVGASLSLFYLVLLSISEFFSFGMAYAVATISSVLPVAYYFGFIMKNRLISIGFGLALFAVFSALYVIIQAEDFSLLMGTALLFLILFGVLIATRKVDWYDLESKLVRTKVKKMPKNVEEPQT